MHSLCVPHALGGRLSVLEELPAITVAFPRVLYTLTAVLFSIMEPKDVSIQWVLALPSKVERSLGNNFSLLLSETPCVFILRQPPGGSAETRNPNGSTES